MGVKPVKTIIVVVIVIISFLCLELLIPAPPKKCNFANTVNISAGHLFSNGSYEFENVIYDKGFYNDYDYIMKNSGKISVENHIRGCLCVSSPCIRICNNYEDLDYIKVYNEDGNEHKINLKSNTDYQIMTHRPCDVKDMYDENDEFIFHKNGSMIIGNQTEILLPEHFCFTNEINADENPTYSICEVKNVDKIDDDDNLKEAKMIYNIVGMFISFPFLLMTLFIYGWIPELHGNVHGKSLMSYIGSLMFLFFFLILVQLDNILSGTFYCKFSGYATYFWVIMCFFWLNVMCYDIWSTFKGRMRGYRKLADNKRFVVYFAYAFGSTTLLTLIVMFLDEVFDVPEEIKPIIGIERCWIRSDRLVEFLYVYFPMSIISVVNIILYSMTAYKIYICQKELASMKTEDFQKHSSVNADKDKFYLYLRLFIIMGVTWVMESVSWVFENSSYMFVFTDALNCLQGFIIFFLFVWKPKVIELIKKRWASSPLRCSKSRADLPINTRCSEVTTKSSLDDYEMRG